MIDYNKCNKKQRQGLALFALFLNESLKNLYKDNKRKSTVLPKSIASETQV